jgi:hypothetical protein
MVFAFHARPSASLMQSVYWSDIFRIGTVANIVKGVLD